MAALPYSFISLSEAATVAHTKSDALGNEVCGGAVFGGAAFGGAMLEYKGVWVSSADRWPLRDVFNEGKCSCQWQRICKTELILVEDIMLGSADRNTIELGRSG